MSNLVGMKKDFVINILASIALVATNQIIVYPAIASKYSTDDYGLFLTFMGLLIMISGAFGNGLNNLRLITNTIYLEKKEKGDFNLFLIFGATIGCFITIIISKYYYESITYIILSILLLIIMILRNYYSVTFRLNLDYKAMLYMNLILSVISVLAVYFFPFEELGESYWMWVFIFSELFTVIYILYNSELWKEPFVLTSLFISNGKKYLNLIYLSTIGGLLLYFDRNLLYPLLGGQVVAIYYVSSLLGKSVSFFVGPISNVMLSYFSQAGFGMTVKRFWCVNITVVAFGVFAYACSLVLSPLVIKNLYPQLYNEAKHYFILANIIPVLNVISDLARPTILKYVDLYKLSIMQTLFFILTCVVSYYAILYSGLYGFCLVAIMLSIIKIVSMWLLGHFALMNAFK